MHQNLTIRSIEGDVKKDLARMGLHVPSIMITAWSLAACPSIEILLADTYLKFPVQSRVVSSFNF
jgi:hypothetical protein